MKRTTLWGLAVLLVAFVAGTAVATNGPRPVDFTFTGRLQADPAAGATSLPVTVKTGNRLALQKLVGQSRNRTFAVDADTEFLLWSQGKPAVVTLDALSAGDLVTVHVVAQRDTPLVQLETTAAKVVADRGQNPGRPHQALWLFRGTLSSATTSTVSIHVFDGNHRALRSMLGASVDETFAFDTHTVFLLLAGQGAVGHRAGGAAGRRPDHRPRQGTARLDARAGRGDCRGAHRAARAEHHRVLGKEPRRGCDEEGRHAGPPRAFTPRGSASSSAQRRASGTRRRP